MAYLDFKGKPFVYSYHLSVPFCPLQIEDKKSLPPKKKKPCLEDNLIIHGDNQVALKSLLPQYAGKIKFIDIDPPYNIGNEGRDCSFAYTLTTLSKTSDKTTLIQIIGRILRQPHAHEIGVEL